MRESAALFDQTSFSKFEVRGRRALAALQRIAAGNLDRPDGSCVYTQLCNERGGIEADVTIMRLAADHFYVVTGSQFGVRDSAWIRRHLPTDGSVGIAEVTSAYAVINIAGPNARRILQATTDDDLSNATFPYLTAREIEIGLGRARAARVGYVGELGWELHIPTEYAAHVYERLVQAGADHGLIDAGYRAIESLRLEKGYVYWSSDVTPDTNPFEAGLGFAVALEKGDFIGREALRRLRDESPSRKLATMTVDGFAPLIGGETILADGSVVGTTTSAGFGYTIGKTIALGYLPATLEGGAEVSIEAYGKLFPAKRRPRSLYDAKGERLKS